MGTPDTDIRQMNQIFVFHRPPLDFVEDYDPELKKKKGNKISGVLVKPMVSVI